MISETSVSSEKKRNRSTLVQKPVNVVLGKSNKENSEGLKGVKPIPWNLPRLHYFFSRVDNNVTEQQVNDYCKEINIDLIGI